MALPWACNACFDSRTEGEKEIYIQLQSWCAKKTWEPDKMFLVYDTNHDNSLDNHEFTTFMSEFWPMYISYVEDQTPKLKAAAARVIQDNTAKEASQQEGSTGFLAAAAVSIVGGAASGVVIDGIIDNAKSEARKFGESAKAEEVFECLAGKTGKISQDKFREYCISLQPQMAWINETLAKVDDASTTTASA